MKFKFTAQVLFTSLALAGVMAYAIEAQAIPHVGKGSGSDSTSTDGQGSGSDSTSTDGQSGSISTGKRSSSKPKPTKSTTEGSESDSTSTDGQSGSISTGKRSSSKPKPTKSTTEGTSFSCVTQKDGNYATVGQRPGGQPIPVIVWTKEGSKYFGEEFSPQVRCDIVTQKINTAVSKNGGSLKNVLLTNGVINGHAVICALGGSDTACNSNNRPLA